MTPVRRGALVVFTTLAAFAGLVGMVPAGAAVGDGLDPTFSADGTVDLGSLTPTAYAPLDNGGLVVAGDVPGDPYGRFEVRRYTASGALDPTWSFDGRVRLRFAGGAPSRAIFVVPRPNGHVYIVGLWNPVGAGTRLGVIRTTAKGGYDSTYAGDGRLTTALVSIPMRPPLDPEAYQIHDARLLADGRFAIVLSSRSSDTSSNFQQWMVRLRPNGTLDPSLLFLGMARISDFPPVASATRSSLEGMKILPSGRYFRLVRATTSAPYVHALSKHLSIGGHDVGFDDGEQDGKVWLRCAPGDGAFTAALLLDPAHRPLVTCGIEDVGNDETTEWVRRFTRTGSLDTTFSDDGVATVEFTPRAGADAMLDPVGRPIAFTRANDFRATRLTATGAVDAAFGIAGTATATFPSSSNIDCRTGPTRMFCLVLRSGPATELVVAVATS